MTKEKIDFERVLKSLKWIEENGDNFKFPRDGKGDCERIGFALRYHLETIQTALKLADAIQKGEVSDEEQYKAMSLQLLEDIKKGLEDIKRGLVVQVFLLGGLAAIFYRMF